MSEINNPIVMLTQKHIYDAVKNYIHNECGYKKENMTELVERVMTTKISSIIESKVDNYLKSPEFDKIVLCAMETVAKRVSNPTWGSASDIRNGVQKIICQKIAEKIEANILDSLKHDL